MDLKNILIFFFTLIKRQNYISFKKLEHFINSVVIPRSTCSFTCQPILCLPGSVFFSFFPHSPDAQHDEQKSNEYVCYCGADGRGVQMQQVCWEAEAMQSKYLVSFSHMDEST